ncbi:hypothetical protein ACWD00_29470 [Streptomyces viridiviolaceus]
MYVLLLLPGLLLLVPDSATTERQRFDVPGAVLLGAGTAAVLFVLTQSSKEESGLGGATVVILVIAAMLALVAFVMRERRITQPMLEGARRGTDPLQDVGGSVPRRTW